MDEGQPGEPRPDRPEQPEDPADLEEERSSEEDRQAREIPVDQRALNIVGIAQARDYLRAGRAATVDVGRSCPTCGSTLAHVTPADEEPDVIVVCADCGRISYEGPATQLGLDEPAADRDELIDLDDLPEQEERRQSRQRHPATQSRLRRQN